MTTHDETERKKREELQAEIEDGKKKIRQLENREKVLRQKLSQEERRTRSHRLIVRGAVFESIVPEAKTMTDEEAGRLSPACPDERGSAGLSEKTHRGREKRIIPLVQRAHLYTLTGACALPRALSAQRESRLLPSLTDIGGLCRNKGLHPLRRLRGYPCTPTKTVYPPLASVPFLRVFILSGR